MMPMRPEELYSALATVLIVMLGALGIAALTYLLLWVWFAL